MNDEIENLQNEYEEKIYSEINQLNLNNILLRENETRFQTVPPFAMFARENLDSITLQTRFNTFFRDDLYGRFRENDNIILSSGSLDPNEFPLCFALQYAIDFALQKKWYGYSDSLGHIDARNAIADLMQLRIPKMTVLEENIALISGVTSGLNTVLYTLKKIIGTQFRILTHLPTYSPFFTACHSVAPVDYVMLTEGHIDVNNILEAIGLETKVILLLGDLNPLGQMISVPQLNEIISECTKRKIWLVFDEAGAVYPEYDLNELITSPYFILLNSDSKMLGVPGFKTGFLVGSKYFVNSFYSEASRLYGSPASIFYLFQEFNARFRQFRLLGLDELKNSQMALFREDYLLSLPFLNLLYKDYLVVMKRNEERMNQKRNWVVDTLLKVPQHLISQILVPETGVNLSIHIAQWDDSYQFFLELLKEKKVSVFPGKCSGIDSGCWVRVSYAVSDEVLHSGINALILFLEEQDVYSKVISTPLYYHYLVERGGYLRYPWLNFFGHLRAVYQTMKWLYALGERKLSDDLDTLFEEMSFLHDCGKVISVRLASVHRIWKKQEQGTRSMETFSDLELLGQKKMLLSGVKFSQDELKNMVGKENEFWDLIEWEKGYSPNDEAVRDKIFSESQVENRAISLLKKRVSFLGDESDTDSVYIALLDIADKLSDYTLLEADSIDILIEKLRDKETYVIGRYGYDEQSNKKIHEEFQLTEHNLRYWVNRH